MRKWRSTSWRQEQRSVPLDFIQESTQRRHGTVVIIAANKSECVSLSHTPCFICTFQPSDPPDSEWVTLLFTIFQILSLVFGLAFSLAITGLQGFSNGAFEEITLFSPSSREKTETFGRQLAQSITHTEPELSLTHLAAKISLTVTRVCGGIRTLRSLQSVTSSLS